MLRFLDILKNIFESASLTPIFSGDIFPYGIYPSDRIIIEHFQLANRPKQQQTNNNNGHQKSSHLTQNKTEHMKLVIILV